MLTPGIKGHAALRVTTENTALAMGSGELPVLATPAVAALIERRHLHFSPQGSPDCRCPQAEAPPNPLS